MGMLGEYIDSLPDAARDRLIEAQEWCLGDVAGAAGGRCLIGHAEDWTPLAAPAAGWAPPRWGAAPAARTTLDLDDVTISCSREFFTFRRMQPLDLAVYRTRLERWGLASESLVGSRFDRLCVRRGVAGAVRLVKRRAARGAGLPATLSAASAAPRSARGTSPASAR